MTRRIVFEKTYVIAEKSGLVAVPEHLTVRLCTPCIVQEATVLLSDANDQTIKKLAGKGYQ